jgi:hypothetical protein
MKIALRIFAYIASTYFIGGTIANTYLNWPMDMPDWLHASVMFAIRVTGLGELYNADHAELWAMAIIACISWTLTGLALWLLARAAHRLAKRRKT